MEGFIWAHGSTGVRVCVWGGGRMGEGRRDGDGKQVCDPPAVGLELRLCSNPQVVVLAPCLRTQSH